MKTVLFTCIMVCVSAFGQDAATTSAMQMQQDMLATGQANMQAMQQMNEFNQIALQQMLLTNAQAGQRMATVPPPWNNLKPEQIELLTATGFLRMAPGSPKRAQIERFLDALHKEIAARPTVFDLVCSRAEVCQ